ncbi:uncharacterized protein [Leptinotarsa decemlineata]|uniref:uncharacterized protein n=1 Tax=Leptinotarsa decemlineata TaxID=7539 RepID=UPI003D30A77A
MIQFEKIITSKSVILLLIFSTTTSYGFIKNDHRVTSRRYNIRESRNLPDRRQQIERNLNIRNGPHKIDEKDRVYENLYDRRSFRTGTLERNESTERRSTQFSIADRREVRNDFSQRNDNRVSVNNRQRFSNYKHQSAESSRYHNLFDNRRFVNKIELNRENRKQVPMDRRTNYQSTKREFENRRQFGVDRTNVRSASFEYQRITVPNKEITEIPSVYRRFRVCSSRSDSTRQIQRNARTNNYEKKTDSTVRFSVDNARNFERKESRIVLSKDRSNQQVRNEQFRSNRNRHMPDFEQRLNTLTSRLPHEYRRDTARNQLDRVMPDFEQRLNTLTNRLPHEYRRDTVRNQLDRVMPNFEQRLNTLTNRLPHEYRRDTVRNQLDRVSSSNIRNEPRTRNTRRDFRLNSKKENHFREEISRETERRNQRNSFGNSEKRTVSIRYNSPALEARRLETTTNVIPQARVSNSYSVRHLPEKQFSLVSTELEGKSVDLQNSPERFEYLKPNLDINSWVNAAQVILGIYLLGQIFLNSSTKSKPRFNMLSTVGAVKNKIH